MPAAAGPLRVRPAAPAAHRRSTSGQKAAQRAPHVRGLFRGVTVAGLVAGRVQVVEGERPDAADPQRPRHAVLGLKALRVVVPDLPNAPVLNAMAMSTTTEMPLIWRL